MELFDAHTLVMSAVLLIHIAGVMIVAVSAVVLVMSTLAVVLAVRGVKTTWALRRHRFGRATGFGVPDWLFDLPAAKQRPETQFAESLKGNEAGGP